jgi:hypothetical protein
MRTTPCAFAILAIVCFSGCGGGGGGGGGGGQATIDATGTWNGTWQSSNGINSGSLEVVITQTGNSITGSISFTGSPCFSGGPITGFVNGANITATLNAGGIQVNVAGAVSGVAQDDLNGTYNVVSAGACTGDTGTASLTRTAPLTIGEPKPPESITFVYNEAGELLGILGR